MTDTVLPRPTMDTPADQVRLYLRTTGWTLKSDGWWYSPPRKGPHAPKGVSVFAISDDRWDRADDLRGPGIREIARAEDCDYGRMAGY